MPWRVCDASTSPARTAEGPEGAASTPPPVFARPDCRDRSTEHVPLALQVARGTLDSAWIV